jgi:HSP20 family protein
LVVTADLRDLEDQDDVRVENNVLAIRGERNLEKNSNEDNYFRIERVYGSFIRSFSLPNAVALRTFGPNIAMRS